jgi:type I restriction enzyme S subunit
LKTGYKHTEVGLIPEDWDVLEVKDFARVITGPFGTLLKASEYAKYDGVPLISVGEIGDGFFRIDEHTPRAPARVVSRLPQYLLRTGDVVFGRKGAVDRSALVTEKENGWFLGSDGISVRPTSNCHPPYVAAQFRSWATKSWLLQNAIGTTMASLNQRVLGRVKIPLAPLPEQSSIATALSDVDALLAAQDALIAKQRAIKQGAMQELLTGRTRLPRFDGKWEVRRFGNHLKFLKNGTNSRAELSNVGHIKYLHYGDIHRSNEVILNVITRDMPFLSPARAEKLARLENGDLVFADASEDLTGVAKSVEVHGAIGQQVVPGLHTIAVRFDKSILADGFKAYLQFMPTFRNHLLRLVAGTKVLSTNRAHISGCEIALPSIEEQRAIAEVLNDIDAEIAALEAKRAKTALLKQGMMQELLTGRIRLA